MQTELEKRIGEIDLCLLNEDLNRAGQRLLDLTYDYEFGQAYRESSLELRKKYNEGKELGRAKHANESLSAEYRSLFDSIVQVKPQSLPALPPLKVLASISGIGKQFRSRLHNFHFRPISIELVQGTIIGLVGENGNGKTTLLRMICGDLAEDEGSIEYYIDGLSTNDWQLIKKKIAFIPQRQERWYGTIQDKLSFNAAIKGYRGELNTEKVDFIIHRMGLTNFRELSWNQLSGGYKLRFEIAMALVWDPAVLILDEPLANLDIQAQELLLQDLRNLADSLRNPVSIILSSQQLHEVETVADRIIFLKNGNAIFNGSLHEFRQQETSRTFEINGSFTYQELQKLLEGWSDVRIEQSASSFTISCSAAHSKEELFRLLLGNNYSIEYFRNISGSTKKLFSDKY
ncbi:MAG: transporter ATP-binding protein [Bacteroidetes bacterium]|nr:transporter ATP-binding protein [Bacteroidota bacterium]